MFSPRFRSMLTVEITSLQIWNWEGCFSVSREKKKQNKNLPIFSVIVIYIQHLHCSCYSSADMSHICWNKLCKTKIWNFGCKIFVKEDVACFYIPVNNMRPYFFMKVSQSTSNPNTYFTSCSPIKEDPTMTSTYK